MQQDSTKSTAGCSSPSCVVPTAKMCPGMGHPPPSPAPQTLHPVTAPGPIQGSRQHLQGNPGVAGPAQQVRGGRVAHPARRLPHLAPAVPASPRSAQWPELCSMERVPAPCHAPCPSLQPGSARWPEGTVAEGTLGGWLGRQPGRVWWLEEIMTRGMLGGQRGPQPGGCSVAAGDCGWGMLTGWRGL